MTKYLLSTVKQKKRLRHRLLKIGDQEEEDFGMNIYICENTDCILTPMEQMTYALNETQVKYGSVVILKNAP